MYLELRILQLYHVSGFNILSCSSCSHRLADSSQNPTSADPLVLPETEIGHDGQEPRVSELHDVIGELISKH